MTTQTTPIRVLFVCLGNICRSPMAEAVFQKIVADAGLERRFEIASVGTGAWHVGERPHPGTQAVLQRYNVPLRSEKRAQRLRQEDLETYDYIIAMDGENVQDIERYRAALNGKLVRLLEFASSTAPRDVPDPYYTQGFDQVYNLVLDGCMGLLEHIRGQRQI
ncbi:MAG: low molecular weight phosphotyrosine protein phosphatase [Chloroflexaceae bacterium]|nr:low molecular weight phosphotyrosine protein phosphatase [Chloroflexaceae bacterium]NJO06888.1 low molecular weight phosphotyrosine protein phosphatase [Chloroflexaceae bacterium]